MKPALLLCSLLALPLLTPAADAIYIAANETEALEAKEGQKITVYGKTTGSGKSSSGTNFVNFDGAEFYLVTFKTDLAEFPDGEPSDLYDGKRLAVTGTVSVYQGKPQIKLTSPDQVEILAEDAKFPPVEMKPEEAEEKPETAPEKAADEKPAEEAKPEKPEPPVDPSQYFKK